MRTRFFRPRLESLDERIVPSLTMSGAYSLNHTATNHEYADLVTAVGDFDGDGHADLAVATNEAYMGYGFGMDLTNTWVEVLRGRGDGSFDPARVVYVSYQHAIEGSLIVVGDVNVDGRSDLVVDAWNGPDFSLLGNADGSFTVAEAYPFPQSPAAPDMNGDGYADAVVIPYTPWNYYGPSYMSVSLRRPDGTYSPPLYFYTAGATGGAVGDFNGDGRPDVAAANRWQTVTVLLNDGDWPVPDAPSVTVNDVTVTEGNTGTVSATFTVSLSHASASDVTLNHTTANGTGTSGNDYQGTSGTLTIPAGQATGTITVLVNGDRLGEPNETYFVNLSNPTNATITDSQGVGTLLDDEPRISISDFSKKEGKRGQTTLFTFTVTLSTAYDQPVTMSYRTVNGTATTSDNDYVAKSGALTFAPGQTTKTITIEVKGDSKKEGNETFYVDLFGLSGNALFTKNRGLGAILNDD